MNNCINYNNYEEVSVCVIFDKYDGIIHDLIYILMNYISTGCNINPCDLPIDQSYNEKTTTSESKIKKLIEKYQLDYDNAIESKLRCKSVELVIFIATNDSIRSDKCKRLLYLSQHLPIVSLIVEDIENLDEIKSTILCDIDYHFDISKDRVFDKGYDQYMWLGENFQNFIDHFKEVLNIKRPAWIVRAERMEWMFKRSNLKLKDFFFSYSLSNNTSPKSIRDVIQVINDEDMSFMQFDLIGRLNDELKDKNSFIEQIKKPDSGFDYYDYLLKREHIDMDVKYYLSILREFDQAAQNSEILKNIENATNINIDNCQSNKYGFIYKHIKDILECYEYNDKITLFLKEEIKKKNGNIDLINNIFGLFCNSCTKIVYNEFLRRKTIVFLLTKEYYDSKKFQKMFYEAKRWEKNIFLVKLEPFEIKIDDGYNEIYIHDVSKHKNTGYEGFLTRILKNQFSYCCGTGNHDLNYKIWYEIFIFSNCDSKGIRNMKKMFEKQNIRNKCNFEYDDVNEEKFREIDDDLEKSKIILYCLTNDYLKSGKFYRDFFIFYKKKPILFLLMEEIEYPKENQLVKLNSFKVIEYYKFDSTGYKGELFYRLCYFVYLLLDFKQSKVSYEHDGEVKLQSIDSKSKDSHKNISILKRGKFVKLIQKCYDNLVDIKFIRHLNIYCFLTSSSCCFHDADFNFTHESIHLNLINYKAVLYHEKNEIIYLVYRLEKYYYIGILDDQMQFKMNKQIQTVYEDPEVAISDNHIFVRHANLLTIFELKLNLHLTLKIPDSILFDKIIIEPRYKNHIYMVNYAECFIYIFNMNSFNCSEKIILNRSIFHMHNCMVSNDLIFEFKKHEKTYSVWEINYDKNDDSISSNLVCQLNKYPPHLLKHPYVLPCGSIACLECIYENCNLYLNKFICAACGNKHQKLKNQLVKSSVIEDNLRRISETRLDYLKQSLNYDAIEKHGNFENFFKFIEDDIEIRVESIKIQLDEHEEAQIKCIDKLEKKLLKMINKTCKKKMKTEMLTDVDINRIVSNFPYTKMSKITCSPMIIPESRLCDTRIGYIKFHGNIKDA